MAGNGVTDPVHRFLFCLEVARRLRTIVVTYQREAPMSRLDRHIIAVRNKIALGHFLHALMWLGLGIGIGVLLLVIEQRQTWYHWMLPRPMMWLAGSAAVAVLAAAGWSLFRRPN